MAALDGLKVLTRSLGEQDPAIALAQLQKKLLEEEQRNREFAAADPRHFGTGATATDVQGLQSDLAASPYGDEATARRAKLDEEVAAANRPDVQAISARDLAAKLKLSTAPAEAAAKGNLAVEQAKEQGLTERQQRELDAQQKLREAVGIGTTPSTGAGTTGAAGTWKPAINAKGEISFSQNQMPALVQRAHDQLADAHSKTLATLQEAERLYPGINDEATKVDANTGGSALGRLFGMVTGIGAPKYGGPSDRANAGVERFNYTQGVATPFSNLAQEASFGNIEQMAGQLPGVRGLSTLVPMFKEHQTRWGHETPLATVQRARHMARIMEDTLNTIESGGGGAENPAQGSY